MDIMFTRFHSALMPAAEKLPFSDVAAITITGLVVVFLALIILIVFITVMGKIFESIQGKNDDKKNNETPESKPAPAPAPLQAALPPASHEDEEVVAAITAAITMMSQADGTSYKIKSIRQSRPANASRPAWAMAGLRDNTTPF